MSDPNLLNLCSNVMERARGVDLIHSPPLQKIARMMPLPEHTSALSGAEGLEMLYHGNPVDGRILVVEFLDYLDGAGRGCDVPRPSQLESDNPDFQAMSTGELQAFRSDAIQTGLVHYARGVLKLTDANTGEPRYTMTGVLPMRYSVAILPPYPHTSNLDEDFAFLNAFSIMMQPGNRSSSGY